MRSTRASAAIDRLNRRSANAKYSMEVSGNGLFCLLEAKGSGASCRMCHPMNLDEFVVFVNACGPQTPKRISKLDLAFEKQLGKKIS